MNGEMKKAVFKGKKTIISEKTSIPEIKDDEILVKIMAAGICGTDVHIFEGEEGSAKVSPPVVLGHEFSGVVEKTGADVTTLGVGDKVTADPNIYCGKCYFCRTGKKHLCYNIQALGVTMDGGFAQYCAVPEKQAIKLDDNVDFEDGAFAEPLACCLHGIDRANITAGETVVIIGGGTIGLIMVQLAKLRGASTIILSEPIKLRRELGLKLGANAAIDPKKSDLKSEVHKIINDKPINVIIECAGNPHTARQSIEIADKGSRILFFSVPGPTSQLSIPLFELYKKELTILSSFINPNTQQYAAELINSGTLRLKELITHRYSIDETAEAIAKQKAKDSVKVFVKPWQ